MALSATGLLTSGELGRIKECPHEEGGMRLAVLRREQEQEPQVVRHGRLRQPRQDAEDVRPQAFGAGAISTVPL